METNVKRFAQVTGAIAIAAGLGLGAAGLASAATTPGSSAPPSSASASRSEGKDANDAAEAVQLQAAAKITPDQATKAALASVPGTVNKVELDSENGKVVFSVEVAAGGKTIDVKVDAVTGAVVGRDSGEQADHHESGAEKSGTETPNAAEGAGAEGTG